MKGQGTLAANLMLKTTWKHEKRILLPQVRGQEEVRNRPVNIKIMSSREG
jgi:hypothetical protein